MRKKVALVLVLAFVLVFAVQALAKDMEGEVTAVDRDAKTVTVSGVSFDAGDVDLSGIEVGDTVKVTYKEEGGKKILESIEVAEEEFIPLEGC